MAGVSPSSDFPNPKVLRDYPKFILVSSRNPCCAEKLPIQALIPIGGVGGATDPSLCLDKLDWRNVDFRLQFQRHGERS